MSSLTSSLPIPGADALSHSAQLTEYLKQRIQSLGGWMSFAAFMDDLLYAPGLGYYAAGAAKFRAEGDFITAPEISPLFGRTIAQWIAPTLKGINDAQILEPGAGTGRLAASLLETLAQLGALPEHYLILEPSPSLQEIQRRNLTEWIPSLISRVQWIQAPPAQLKGVIVANEVCDALPVHLMVTTEQAGIFLERGVEWAEKPGGAISQNIVSPSDVPPGKEYPESHFAWQDRPASMQLNELAFQHLPQYTGLTLQPSTVFELGLPAEAWCRSMAGALQQGQIILIDYGFPARELYHPQRHNGTLMCHYRHFAHDDPFLYPGLQDVTAHIDFTAIARVLSNQGLQLEHYQTQANFLLHGGILETLTPGLQPGSVDWLKETTALQKLLSPAEMGELFKVLVASRHLHAGDEESTPAHLSIKERLGL